jgi:hypothetical protein
MRRWIRNRRLRPVPIGKAMVSEHGLKPCARQWRFDLQMREWLLAFDQPVFRTHLPVATGSGRDKCATLAHLGALNAAGTEAGALPSAPL